MITRCGRPYIPALVVTAAAVLAAGCGGGGSQSSSSANRPTAAATGAKQFVAFAVCMRSHGVSGYPDPQISSSGNSLQVTISPGSADPNSPAFRSADRTCHTFLPNGGARGGGGANDAQQRAQDVVYAECMRAHGVPSFPDADHDGVFNLPSTTDQQAPAFRGAIHACQNTQPSSLAILNQPPGSS